MEAKPSISRLIELQKMLLAFRAIERKTAIPPDNTKLENDTEHSYSLAMTAWFLAQYFPEIDSNTVVKLALAHDLIEVHSGDTFAYGDAANLASKHDREAAAQKRLAEDWQDFPDMHDAIQEYESLVSNEAKFVYSLDKLMPALLNYLSDGYLWKKYGITIDMFRKEKEAKMPVSSEVYPYYEALLKILLERPDMFPPTTTK